MNTHVSSNHQPKSYMQRKITKRGLKKRSPEYPHIVFYLALWSIREYACAKHGNKSYALIQMLYLSSICTIP